MSFQDDQRAEILSITEQMSFEYFRDLDPGPGTVGPAGTDDCRPALPPSQEGGSEGGGTFTLADRGSRPSPRCLQLGSGEAAFFVSLFFFLLR